MPKNGTSRTEAIIDTLNEQLPKVFEQHDLPGTWDRDWITAALHDPESAGAESTPKEWLWDDAADNQSPMATAGVATECPWTPVLNGRFPGAPVGHDWSGLVPPPDALAFYLPFHYYYPRHWGIYVTADGENWLARFLQTHSGGTLSFVDGRTAARVFLYGHEAYHHVVESFGTRLETTHRRPLYKLGMEALFQETVRTDDCVEEALANVYGRDKALAVCRKNWHWPASKLSALNAALIIYFKQSGPGYRKATEYLSKRKFTNGESAFAERNQIRAVSPMPDLAPAIWGAFPHAFGPIANIRSRVKYIVHRDSPYRFRVEQLRMAGV